MPSRIREDAEHKLWAVFPGFEETLDVLDETLEEDDANNILYRFEASFDYDPEAYA